MCPSVYIFGQNIFLYDIFLIFGTIAGLGIMFFTLYKTEAHDKRLYIVYVLSLFISAPFSRVLRGISEAYSLEEFIKSGSHFMGMVLVFYFIFPVIYRPVYKQKPCEGVKSVSSLFFLIQHIFSRIGCYTLGCCFGKPYKGPFSIVFPYGTNPYNVYGREVNIFPTQIFEVLFSVFILIAVVWGIKKRKNYTFSLFVLLFSLCIFISEFFMYRYGYEREILIFSIPQICCIIIGISELFRRMKYCE